MVQSVEAQSWLRLRRLDEWLAYWPIGQRQNVFWWCQLEWSLPLSQTGALWLDLRVQGWGWIGGGLMTSRALPLYVHHNFRDKGSANPLQVQAGIYRRHLDWQVSDQSGKTQPTRVRINSILIQAIQGIHLNSSLRIEKWYLLATSGDTFKSQFKNWEVLFIVFNYDFSISDHFPNWCNWP